MQSEVLREARCCEHEGADTSVDVLILETPVICHGACDCVTSLHFVLKIFGHHGEVVSSLMSSQEFGVQSSTTPQGILEYVKNVLVVENLII